jgi:2-dehydro-3-deoxygluconokinase
MIVTFGELMFRITPKDKLRLFQTPNFTITPGGAEANVAVSLANYGERTAFVTALPDNPIGNALRAELRRFGVDDTCIVTFGERVGLYFTETGSNMRPSMVVYDRTGSAISECPPDKYNWEEILNGATWFHTTGITPAVSEYAWKATIEVLELCREKRIPVSCDLNYRKNLWKWGRGPLEVMPEITRYVDYLIANEEDCQKCLGIEVEADVEGGRLDVGAYKILGKSVLEEYPNLKALSVSLRESVSADYNRWSGILINRDNSYLSKKYEIRNIVDRVGGGDSFGAGLIYGFRHFDDDFERTINFAIAASALKHSVYGDFNRVSLDEVLRLVDGDESGRIKR